MKGREDRQRAAAMPRRKQKVEEDCGDRQQVAQRSAPRHGSQVQNALANTASLLGRCCMPAYAVIRRHGAAAKRVQVYEGRAQQRRSRLPQGGTNVELKVKHAAAAAAPCRRFAQVRRPRHGVRTRRRVCARTTRSTHSGEAARATPVRERTRLPTAQPATLPKNSGIWHHVPTVEGWQRYAARHR